MCRLWCQVPVRHHKSEIISLGQVHRQWPRRFITRTLRENLTFHKNELSEYTVCFYYNGTTHYLLPSWGLAMEHLMPASSGKVHLQTSVKRSLEKWNSPEREISASLPVDCGWTPAERRYWYSSSVQVLFSKWAPNSREQAEAHHLLNRAFKCQLFL